jgi:hypothetical protein
MGAIVKVCGWNNSARADTSESPNRKTLSQRVLGQGKDRGASGQPDRAPEEWSGSYDNEKCSETD